MPLSVDRSHGARSNGNSQLVLLLSSSSATFASTRPFHRFAPRNPRHRRQREKQNEKAAVNERDALPDPDPELLFFVFEARKRDKRQADI